MKIAVVCANGRTGRLIVKEAVSRGLDVTAIARGENRTAAAQYIQKDLFDLTAQDLAAYDVVVDAFGAGDSFCAGILTGFLEGWPLERTLQYANAIGSMVVSRPGNIEAIPDRRQVEAFLQGRGGITR